MASPYEQTFLSSLTERKRKRSDISEGLERLKNVSLSELSDLCSVLSKDDILWLLQAKVPNALRLAEIVRALPSAMPRAARNTLLTYYFKTFAAVGEIDRETFVNVLLFCTADQQKSGNDVTEMEILAPPISNCIKCKSPLISQNKMCTVTVFSLEKGKSAMKLSCRCKDCKLNYGYSMFGNAEEGFHFYEVQRPYVEASDDVFLDRNLCLFQVSLANHSWVSFVGFAESFTEVVRNTPSGFQRLPAELQQVATKKSVNRLDRKMVSSAFYWHEIECEIMERSLDWSFKGKLEDARDEFMKFIESKRRTENYAHPVKDCSQMCKERGSDPSDVNVKNADKINDVVANLQTDSWHRGSSAAQSQGTEMFISKHHSILQECESDENGDAVCNKDTGESQKSLRKWSRGLLHFVRAMQSI